MAAGRHLGKFQMTIHQQRVTDPLHAWFKDGVFKWRYFRFDEIQDGGRPPSWNISKQYISGTTCPSHFHEIEKSFAKMWERIMREKQNGNNLKYFLYS